jgi:AraC family transcriptional regulator, transcriptional activator of pobA
MRDGPPRAAADRFKMFDRFYLYGEPARPAEARFVHLENLDDRSRPANWTIRPHVHLDLHHIFLVETGGGRAEADGQAVSFAAPCIVVVPAGVVHGFRWVADTAGRVLTFAESFMRRISEDEPTLPDLFSHGLWTAPMEGASVPQAYGRLQAELGWAAAGHALALTSHLSAILVEAMRLHQQTKAEAYAPPGPHARLVARYRALIEAHYREHPSVEWSAAQLGVSPNRLRAACRAVASLSPTRILHNRLRVEAERVMRYSNMSVAQVGFYLGFSDPAYFSRFFSRKHGAPPRVFRERRP